MLNDYELIYLYKEDRSDEVLERIIDKYRPLIWKYIYKFYVDSKDQEDFYQEALLALIVSIDSFDEKHNKTFTKFFELVLFRRFITLKDKAPKYVLFPKSEIIQDSYTPDFDRLEENVHLAPFEKEVCRLHYDERLTIETISKMLEKDKKSVRNAIHRIKVKLRE